MNLNEIKSPYNAIISLGSTCQTAYQIKRKKLKNSFSPLDLVLSPNLTDVNRLIKNRFKGLLDIQNLSIEGKVDGNYIVKDNVNNIVSYHDFPIVLSTEDPLSTYAIFKEKQDKRINDFFKKCSDSDSVLFVRGEANSNEVVELNSILETIVNKDFRILVVNYSKNPDLVERDWQIDNVCSIEIKETWDSRWQGCDSSWDQIFEGISLRT